MGHGNQTTVAEPREGAQAAKAQDAAEVKQKVAPALAEAARDPARQDAIPPAFRLLMSKLVSGALDTAVRLGLPDLMKDGRPHSVDDLAAACGAQPELLNRLMRCLCNDDVFVENESRVFSLGEAGQFFRTDHPMSVTEFSHLFCGEALATHWDCLYDRVKEGKTCNAKLYGGLPLLEFWMKPKNFPQFKRFHDNLSRLSVPGIVHAYRNEWRKYNVICDVCGANDFLLAEVLKNGNPHARGILFDDPPIAEMANATQQQLGVADRVDCIGGDVFEAVPRADLFMIKQTVHPWNDEMVVKMLKNCRESLNRGGKILIMEAVLSDEPNVPEFNRYIDMLHMLHSDGRERTENEFRSVCAQAGLRIVRVFKPMGILPFIECEPLQA